MLRIPSLFLALTLFLTGCATVNVQKENVYPTASADKALVYFYRESRFTGGAISYYVHTGKTRLGALGSGTYFFAELPPGEYTFWAETEARDQVTLDLKAGETYYVRGGVSTGFFAGHPELTVVHEVEGKGELPNLKYATTTQE